MHHVEVNEVLIREQLISRRQLQQLEEQKKQLEHYNATIQEEKDTLVLQNNSLTERLEAVTNKKLPSHQFDGQTPIDKTLDLLQCLIMVGLALFACTYIFRKQQELSRKKLYVLPAFLHTHACSSPTFPPGTLR